MGAAPLVEQHLAAHLLGVRLAQPLGAELATGLLVDDRHHEQIAARGAPALAREPGRGGDLGGDLGLHVKRAAPPHEAFGDFPRPRIVAPLARVREDGVDVAEIAERGAFASPFQPGHQVRALGHSAEQLAPKARVREDRLQVLDRGPLVAGRIYGVEADQALKQPGCVVHAPDPTPPGKAAESGTRGQAASSWRV